jgi:hypothetical protein
MVETSFKVPAYNGELRPAQDRAEDNTVGSLAVNNRDDPVTTEPFQVYWNGEMASYCSSDRVNL